MKTSRLKYAKAEVDSETNAEVALVKSSVKSASKDEEEVENCFGV